MPELRVRFEGLDEFRATLKALEPAVAKQFDKKLRKAQLVVIAGARAAASWSKRIPRSIGSTTSKRGVGIRVSKAKAPHGPLYELGSSGTPRVVRHPLFGDREHWYESPVRPFFFPVIARHEQEMADEAVNAVAEAKREVGLT